MKKGIDLYNHILRDEKRDKAWQMWISTRANYTKDNYMTFEEYWNRLTGKVDTTPAEEILEHAEDIRRRAAKK